MQKRIITQFEGLNLADQKQLVQMFNQKIEKEAEKMVGVSTIFPSIEIAEETREMMENPNYKQGLMSGYKRLDMITGGFSEEELIIVAGATGHGKTLFAQNILHNMGINSVPSLFISMEMSNKKSLARYIEMHRSGVDEQGYGAAALPFFFLKMDRKIDIESVESAIQEGIKKHGIKIVLIDHLHYFARSADHVREQIDIMTMQMKQLAMTYKIPIVLIAHTRKLESDSAKPQEVDLKDSSGIAQDADQVILIWRNKSSEVFDERKDLYFSVTKNRDKGTTGAGHLKISDNWKLYELPEVLQKEGGRAASEDARKSKPVYSARRTSRNVS